MRHYHPRNPSVLAVQFLVEQPWPEGVTSSQIAYQGDRHGYTTYSWHGLAIYNFDFLIMSTSSDGRPRYRTMLPREFEVAFAEGSAHDEGLLKAAEAVVDRLTPIIHTISASEPIFGEELFTLKRAIQTAKGRH